MPGVRAAWADTLDRDLLQPECQANQAHRGEFESLSGTGKCRDKEITLCLQQVISNESFKPLFYIHKKPQTKKHTVACYSLPVILHDVFLHPPVQKP